LTAGGFALLVLGGPSALALDELNRRMHHEERRRQFVRSTRPAQLPTR
jgi:hypothetical protein